MSDSETVAIEEEIAVVEEPKYMTINGYVKLNGILFTISWKHSHLNFSAVGHLMRISRFMACPEPSRRLVSSTRSDSPRTLSSLARSVSERPRSCTDVSP